jgi:hypothetical protein
MISVLGIWGCFKTQSYTPELLREGRLVEGMRMWRFRTYDPSVVHLGNRHLSRPVRVFKEFASQMASTLFPKLPT